MPSALGGFVSGLQGGMEFQENRRRSKRINKALDYELDRIGLAQEGQQATHARALEMEGRDPVDYTKFGVSEDPYQGVLSKAFGSFRRGLSDMFTRGQPASVDPTSLQKPEMGYTDGVPNYAIEEYADGGEVMEDVARRHPTERQVVDRSRPKRSRVRRALNSKGAKGAGALTYGMAAIDTATTPTEDYQRRIEGTPVGDWLAYDDDDSNAMMLLKDVGTRAVGALTDVGEAASFGMVGGENFADQRAAIRASDVAAQPTDKEAPAERPNQAGPAAPSAPAAPRAAVSQPAQDGPVNFAEAPIVPVDDMPSMSTQDWIAYRSASVADMIAQGASPNEAHEAVTQMQMRGFTNYAQQAMQFLGMGDPGRAAMSLKAAYQYFPNGVDVRFGMTQDAQGQPALVAMGRDEETGESTGQPMLITQERLAVMTENMSNPAAFRTWTKDWRDEEFKRRKYEEIDKQEAQSMADYRAAQGQAALNRSEADRIAAMAPGGGMKQSDLDRAYNAMNDMLGEMGLMEDVSPEEVDYLRRVAGVVYETNPGNYLNTYGDIVQRFRQGGVEAVDAYMRSGG